MPKITKHGGATVYQDSKSFLDSLGEQDSPVEVEEVESSVGNNSSLSSERTPTIDELLKGSRP